MAAWNAVWTVASALISNGTAPAREVVAAAVAFAVALVILIRLAKR